MKDITADVAAVAKTYKYQEPPRVLLDVQNLVERAMRWFNDLLNSFHILVPHGSDTRAVSSVMQLLLYAAGFVAAGLVIYLVWSRLTALKNQTSRARKQATVIGRPLDAAGWKEEAHILAAQGQWRGACRALFLSLLQSLHEAGIAELAPAKTNYEYYRSLAAYPSVQPYFSQLSRLVEDLWFGGSQAARESYENCLTALAGAEAEVERFKRQADAGRPESLTAEHGGSNTPP